ncbi:hypothetical protein EV653_4864 [Kribbella pratensis]|uniref:Uncharacterized protein n=1 Tax=Kribbella pratensis TaxID=2512112 RepID=A0A4R8CB76_9ACTN|nr:hypothetical protein EV653_4864 [Kribbella pratensis]
MPLRGFAVCVSVVESSDGPVAPSVSPCVVRALALVGCARRRAAPGKSSRGLALRVGRVGQSVGSGAGSAFSSAGACLRAVRAGAGWAERCGVPRRDSRCSPVAAVQLIRLLRGWPFECPSAEGPNGCPPASSCSPDCSWFVRALALVGLSAGVRSAGQPVFAFARSPYRFFAYSVVGRLRPPVAAAPNGGVRALASSYAGLLLRRVVRAAAMLLRRSGSVLACLACFCLSSWRIAGRVVELPVAGQGTGPAVSSVGGVMRRRIGSCRCGLSGGGGRGWRGGGLGRCGWGGGCRRGL